MAFFVALKKTYRMKRSQFPVPEFYQNYVELSGCDDINKALKKSTREMAKLLKDIPGKKHDHAYADGKWTIRQLLQHMIDAERVFALRALWFAREEGSALPGFDENKWADKAIVSNRKWKDLTEEFFQLRASTEAMFKAFSNEELERSGTASNVTLHTSTLGYIAAGHVNHHIKVIRERYLKK